MSKKRRSLKKNNPSWKRKPQRLQALHRDVLGNSIRDDGYTRDRRNRKKSISLMESLTSGIIRAKQIDTAVRKPYKPVINMMERRLSICKERSERRRTLFSIGRAGKGVAGPVARLITAASKVRCK